jgi:hypothetical protein
MEMIKDLLYILITAAVPVLTTYVCKFLYAKWTEDLYQQEKDKAASEDMMNDNFILSAEDEEANAITDQEAEDFYQYLESEIEEEARMIAGEL